jgi:GR25 family glycosyltransferase involved in LPS biosynthesis
MTQSVQIIMITGTKERKSKILEQFQELDIPFPIYFLKASFPENSQSYLKEEAEKDGAAICCTRSHIRAIEHAALDTAADVSIIMEDDVALHRTKFVPIVTNIVENWDTLIPYNSHMVSLGWLPSQNYSHFENIQTAKFNKDIKILEYFGYGTQAYMIRKTSAKQFVPIIKHDTFDELRSTINDGNYQYFEKNTFTRTPDSWMNRLFVQSLVFPLVVIEQSVPSTIDNFDAHSVIWNTYFEKRKDLLKEFWSF